jgi:hypothetical protein
VVVDRSNSAVCIATFDNPPIIFVDTGLISELHICTRNLCCQQHCLKLLGPDTFREYSSQLGAIQMKPDPSGKTRHCRNS